ncbi:hypothetical protein [Stratiformator vulcanicus]|uniref:Uncharacterized protein n=1 Tax=Stratiformator vulcanicus TaxID=2527980 RepID=A0A517R4F1_9PLAN|nr:hypothetical protein [Stratiformator vulcanicus]QDT38759.1 hypothetical protein Pan189_31570 [Stratiformator vulcanicus]
MARKTKSRVDLRREAEAAEAIDAADEKSGVKKKKKATRKKSASRARTKKEAPRKRLMWAIFNGSMKEEARFTYGERKQADEKLEQLRAKATKKLYFIQPLKVSLSDSTGTLEVELDDEMDTDDEPVKKKAKTDSDEEE